MGKKKGVKKMATQIAATPTLKGKDAKQLLKSIDYKVSDASKRNGQILTDYFKTIEKKGR